MHAYKLVPSGLRAHGRLIDYSLKSGLELDISKTCGTVCHDGLLVLPTLRKSTGF